MHAPLRPTHLRPQARTSHTLSTCDLLTQRWQSSSPLLIAFRPLDCLQGAIGESHRRSRRKDAFCQAHGLRLPTLYQSDRRQVLLLDLARSSAFIAMFGTATHRSLSTTSSAMVHCRGASKNGEKKMVSVHSCCVELFHEHVSLFSIWVSVDASCLFSLRFKPSDLVAKTRQAVDIRDILSHCQGSLYPEMCECSSCLDCRTRFLTGLQSTSNPLALPRSLKKACIP